MKKTMITGMILIATIVVARADEIEDQIKAQTDQTRIDHKYQSTAACLWARDFQRTIDQDIQIEARFRSLGAGNAATVKRIQDMQNKVDAWRAECNAVLVK